MVNAAFPQGKSISPCLWSEVTNRVKSEFMLYADDFIRLMNRSEFPNRSETKNIYVVKMSRLCYNLKKSQPH